MQRKHQTPFRLLLFLAGWLGAGLAIIHAAPARAGERIRVAITWKKAPLVLKGGPFTVSDGSSEVAVETNPLSVTVEGRQLHLNWEQGKASVQSGARVATRGAPIKIEGAPYAGDVVLHAEDRTKILVVNDLDLEDYLVGIVNHEVSSKWPIEAVKAQVVASRSYALFRKKRPKDSRYDLVATVMDQVYRGTSRADEAAEQAVRETAGLVITTGGDVVEAYYHSCCGGQTESSQAVWGRPESSLQGVPCGFDTDCPNTYWETGISAREIERAFGLKGLADVVVEDTSGSGRVQRLRLQTESGSRAVSGKVFREKMGFNRIRSTNFKVVGQGGSFKFMGSGSGHGVGLCQWGARGMAQAGHPFDEILKRYYTNVEITRAY
ncbi:MAG: SpoIID/LytB domain-containing protein [Nitrospirae bacterium]|nr:SpoIID/LytB domain-containing protein [Nitrospirota bacterium]